MSEVQNKPINVTSNELEFSLQEAAKRRDERVKGLMTDMLNGLVLPQENRAQDAQGCFSDDLHLLAVTEK